MCRNCCKITRQFSLLARKLLMSFIRSSCQFHTIRKFLHLHHHLQTFLMVCGYINVFKKEVCWHRLTVCLNSELEFCKLQCYYLNMSSITSSSVHPTFKESSYIIGLCHELCQVVDHEQKIFTYRVFISVGMVVH